MSQQMYQVINLFDWTGGIRNNRQNPLSFPHQALMSGENADLVDMGIKTRRGMSYHTGPNSILNDASGAALTLFFDSDSLGQVQSGRPITDGTGRHPMSGNCVGSDIVAAVVPASGSDSGKWLRISSGVSGSVCLSPVQANHPDFDFSDSGIDFKVYCYLKKTSGFTSGYLDLIRITSGISGQNWNFRWSGTGSGNDTLVFGALTVPGATQPPGFCSVSGSVSIPVEQWWRVQLERISGVFRIRADNSGSWTSGTVLASISGMDLIPSDSSNPGNLRILKATHGYPSFHVDRFTIERTDADPDVRIRFLKQLRFPTYQLTYLLAQADYSGTSYLCVSNDGLPVSGRTGKWQTITTLGSGAGIVSVASLNDRAVITEGNNKPPLVFAGCMDSSGADWAVPKAALVTFDSGLNFHDVTPALCDKDPDTYADIGTLPLNSGWVLICTDMPQVSGFFVDMASTSGYEAGLTVEGYSGVWSSGSGWKTTLLSGTSTRVLTHSGSAFTGEYLVLNSVPGYWYRIKFPVQTDSATLIRRVLFQAPIQQLQVIGDGQPDTPLGFLFWDNSERAALDWTVEVSDNSWPTVARLNNDPLNTGDSGKEGWQSGAFSSGWDPSGDRLYLGYLTRFNMAEIQPHNDYHNTSGSTTLGAEYWNGRNWVDLAITDGTQEPSGTTFGKKGTVSWITPSAWRQCRPIGPGYPHGYWVRFRVNRALALRTWVSEVRVWPVHDPLKKHKLAITVRDRIILLNRPDAPDQVDISRALEEYGFTGEDSSSMRIGGQDDIVAAVEVFNQGFVAKTEDWFILNGYNPQTFSFERAEAANQVPINNRVVVRAPLTEADQKNLMGLYYLNRFGAWYFAGLKVYHLSQDITWFDAATDVPRIDLDYLHGAYGVYWPERNWIIWSVPMIVDSGQDSQTSNNRLIIYDLSLHTWLPPFTISLASLATAYHYNPDAPGKVGQIGLYGGDYHGRIVRLFGPEDSSDLGEPITGWVETGWLHFGSPEYNKLVRLLTVYGKTSGSQISVTVYSDGDSSSGSTISYSGLSDLGTRLFAQQQKPDNIQGKFFKFRIDFSDVTDVYGLQIGASVIRQWGAL